MIENKTKENIKNLHDKGYKYLLSNKRTFLITKKTDGRQTEVLRK